MSAITRAWRSLFFCLLVLVFAASPAPTRAQQNPFVGSWSGVFAGFQLNYVLQPNFSYSERTVSASLQTMESGNYRLAPPNMISFQVLDWEPKTMPVYHPQGTVGGYYTQQPTSRPPGGTYTYVFNGPNSVTFTDINTSTSITLTRMQ